MRKAVNTSLWKGSGNDENYDAVRGFVGLFDGGAITCSACTSGGTCSAADQQRIDYRPGHCICYVVSGTRIDIHYPSSGVYPLQSFLGRRQRREEALLSMTSSNLGSDNSSSLIAPHEKRIVGTCYS